MITKRMALLGLSLLLMFSLIVPASSFGNSALDKIIEGAKKEGKLNYLCTSGYTPEELAAGIKAKFGVDLDIKISGGRQTQALGNTIMEIKSGTPPSFDLMHMALGLVLGSARPRGAEDTNIDWQSLITGDVDSELYIPAPINYMSPWGYVNTLSYNSEKVAAKDLPKSYMDLADPKYKGKVGWVGYSSANADFVYCMGISAEEGVKFISDLVANKAVMGSFQDIARRVMLGELMFAYGSSNEFNQIIMADPNSPIKFHITQDFLEVNEYSDMVVQKAPHKNAAILAVLFLCTPEGKKLNGKYGFYKPNDPSPNSSEYKQVQAAKKAGTKLVYLARDPKYIEWVTSKAHADLEKKLGVASKGGGGRGGGRK